MFIYRRIKLSEYRIKTDRLKSLFSSNWTLVTRRDLTRTGEDLGEDEVVHIVNKKDKSWFPAKIEDAKDVYEPEQVGFRYDVAAEGGPRKCFIKPLVGQEFEGHVWMEETDIVGEHEFLLHGKDSRYVAVHAAHENMTFNSAMSVNGLKYAGGGALHRAGIVESMFGGLAPALPAFLRPKVSDKKVLVGKASVQEGNVKHTLKPWQARLVYVLIALTAVGVFVSLVFIPQIAVLGFLSASPEFFILITVGLLFTPIILMSTYYLIKSGGVLSKLMGTIAIWQEKKGNEIYNDPGRAPRKRDMAIFFMVSILTGALSILVKTVSVKAAADNVDIKNPHKSKLLPISLWSGRLLSNLGRVLTLSVAVTVIIIGICVLNGGVPLAILTLQALITFLAQYTATSWINTLLLAFMQWVAGSSLAMWMTLLASGAVALYLLRIILKGLSRIWKDIWFNPNPAAKVDPKASILIENHEDGEASQLTNSSIDSKDEEVIKVEKKNVMVRA